MLMESNESESLRDYQPPNTSLPQSNSSEGAPQVSPPQLVGFSFTGTTGEYFRIWIVNLLLSIVTLGFYWPWAMVRTRRYFYSNTHLDGHSFDYLAKPKNLLIGYLIVLVFFAIYLMAGIFNPLFVYPVILVYGIAAPWMIYKAFRFRAKNTSYRNVRFKFCGNLSDSYVTFLAWPALILFTFGLILPYWEMKKKEYYFDNLQFGKTVFNFRPKAAEYYKYYLLFFAIGMGLYFVLIFLAIGAAALFGANANTTNPDALAEEGLAILMIIGAAVGYAFLILIAVVFQKGLWVLIFNYNMTVWTLGKFGFESKMKLAKFVGIAVGNLFASIFSLGLLIPWAKIRITKYKMENLYVRAPEGKLGEHFEAEMYEEGAFGEAATDFMDFEVGL
jgi:uncharacterized membrane protein YjgN (DUF898 family)